MFRRIRNQESAPRGWLCGSYCPTAFGAHSRLVARQIIAAGNTQDGVAESLGTPSRPPVRAANEGHDGPGGEKQDRSPTWKLELGFLDARIVRQLTPAKPAQSKIVGRDDNALGDTRHVIDVESTR